MLSFLNSNPLKFFKHTFQILFASSFKSQNSRLLAACFERHFCSLPKKGCEMVKYWNLGSLQPELCLILLLRHLCLLPNFPAAEAFSVHIGATCISSHPKSRGYKTRLPSFHYSAFSSFCLAASEAKRRRRRRRSSLQAAFREKQKVGIWQKYRGTPFLSNRLLVTGAFKIVLKDNNCSKLWLMNHKL